MKIPNSCQQQHPRLIVPSVPKPQEPSPTSNPSVTPQSHPRRRSRTGNTKRLRTKHHRRSKDDPSYDPPSVVVPKAIKESERKLPRSPAPSSGYRRQSNSRLKTVNTDQGSLPTTNGTTTIQAISFHRIGTPIVQECGGIQLRATRPTTQSTGPHSHPSTTTHIGYRHQAQPCQRPSYERPHTIFTGNATSIDPFYGNSTRLNQANYIYQYHKSCHSQLTGVSRQ